MQGTPIQTTSDWTQGFDDILDCRSPAEYANDRVPGAINAWVLDDEQRARVGTVYKQEGSFAGRRLGAGLVSMNIGRHLAGLLADKPKEWRPLVYCWRGGQRSGAMATVLAQTGFRVTLLQGGYKAYRNAVIDQLSQVCAAPKYVVLTGKTGVGKTRLLKALAGMGSQVLDLEGLANHRGSLFGALGLGEQPSPPMFDSRLFECARLIDPNRVTWVEAESAKVGQLHLPKSLVEGIRAAPQVEVTASLADRVETILQDYGADGLTLDGIEPLVEKLPARVSGEERATMLELTHRGDWRGLSQALIEQHYDPSYSKSSGGNFTGQKLGFVAVDGLDFEAAAKELVGIAKAQS